MFNKFLAIILVTFGATFANAACPDIPNELNFKELEFVLYHISGKYRLILNFPDIKTVGTCSNREITFPDNATGTLKTVHNETSRLGMSMPIKKINYYFSGDRMEMTIYKTREVNGLPYYIYVRYDRKAKLYTGRDEISEVINFELW